MIFLACFRPRETTATGKQKVVIKVCMTDAKKRAKALKIVVGWPGVTSAAVEGNANDQIAVVGQGIDSATLIMILRKKMKSAELISVSDVKEEPKEKPKEEKKPDFIMQPYLYELDGRDPFCFIL